MSKSKPKPKAQQKPIQQILLQRFGQEDFKGQNKLKMKILDIETQNQIHRSKMFQLNETVTKILDKAKIRKGPIPVLENQLGVVAQQLVNVEKMIQIYKKNLKVMTKKSPATEQVQTIADSNLELKSRQNQLQNKRKQIKLLQNKIKGSEYKLNEFSKRGKQKSVDEHGSKMKDAVAENKILKKRLEQIESNQRRREEFIKFNYESTKDLEKKVTGLPIINSSRLGTREERSKTSMTKLQSEKKIYQKWFKTFIPNNLQKLEKQIQDFERITTLLSKKIEESTEEIQTIQTSLSTHKQRVNPSELQSVRQKTKQDEKIKKFVKNTECNCDIRPRALRKDWVGKFDGLRFSDSRHIRQQTRLFSVVHNNIGYYQFSYYSVKDYKKKYVCELPFTINTALKGKQSIFKVDYPDFVKTFKLRINTKLSKIIGMQVISNLGMTYEFIDASESTKPTKQEQNLGHNYEKSYIMKVKPNEAPTLMFGSYSTVYDQKQNLVGVHLEGLGMELIEDYVEELI